MKIPENLYQPIAIEGYEGHDQDASRTRKSCEDRWQMLKKVILNNGGIQGLSLIDIGAATSYFPIRFLQDGGEEAFAVEKDKDTTDLIAKLAEANELALTAVTALKELDQKKTYDIAIYFDLHGHEGINALPWIAPRAKWLFCSVSGDGNKNNEPFFEELHNFYSRIEQVGVGIANRAIFLCTGQKSTKIETKPEKETAPQAPTVQTTPAPAAKPASKSQEKRIKAQTEGKKEKPAA